MKMSEEELHPAVEEKIREDRENEKSESHDMISKANAAAARLEAANAKQEEMLKRQEAAMVKASFGGKAGVNNTEQEESDEEYAQKALRNEL